MEEVSVSIIIPVYKVPERYLRKCIESATNQTYKNIEILLIDDGSPDECGKICDEYAKNNNTVKVIHKINQGLSAARNSGFLAATGKWITFLDGDDWIENDTCEKVLQEIQNNNIEVCMFGVYRDYGNNSKEMKYIYENKKIYRGKECKKLQEDILDFEKNISCAYAKFFKREYLIKEGILHNENLKQGAEGIEFNLRAFENINSALFIKEYFYHYIYNDNSISANSSEENNYLVLKCFETMKQYILTSENKERLLERFWKRMQYVIITTAISGYFNPKNKEKYKEKKKKFRKFLENELVKEVLLKINLKEMNFSRKIILLSIKYKQFWIIYLVANIRYIGKLIRRNKK